MGATDPTAAEPAAIKEVEVKPAAATTEPAEAVEDVPDPDEDDLDDLDGRTASAHASLVSQES